MRLLQPDRRFDLAALTLATVLLRLPAYLAERHLTFDDGVFGASAVAMRAGGRPFADVFSSQGPLFLPLVWLADGVGLRTLDAPRLLAVTSGVALVVAVYLAGRLLADRRGALMAAGLTTTSVSVLGITGPLAADGPALALATLGAALALGWRGGLDTRRVLVLGVVVGAALSVKSLMLPAVVPVAMVLLASGRARHVLYGASSAIAVHLVVALPWGLADVWDQSYTYHLEVAGERTPLANLGKVASTLGDRDLPLVAMALVAALHVAWRPARARPAAPTTVGRPDVGRVRWHERVPTSPVALLGAWLGATVVVLTLVDPLWRPHIAQLVPPGALLVASAVTGSLAAHRWCGRALAVAAVVVVPYHVVHASSLLAPSPYRGSAAEVVHSLTGLPDGALAISDDPGLVWRAGRRTPPDLVDASVLRIETGRITAASVAAAAATDDVCAVAVRSRQRWGSFEDLPERLAAAGYRAVLTDEGSRVLYLKERCAPA